MQQKNKYLHWSGRKNIKNGSKKTEVSKAAMNHHFDVTIESRVKCDALLTGLEASIEQKHDGVCKIIAFASHSLNGADMKHSANNLELLELVSSLDHFKN